jgi:hypothetical protein
MESKARTRVSVQTIFLANKRRNNASSHRHPPINRVTIPGLCSTRIERSSNEEGRHTIVKAKAKKKRPSIQSLEQVSSTTSD